MPGEGQRLVTEAVARRIVREELEQLEAETRRPLAEERAGDRASALREAELMCALMQETAQLPADAHRHPQIGEVLQILVTNLPVGSPIANVHEVNAALMSCRDLAASEVAWLTVASAHEIAARGELPPSIGRLLIAAADGLRRPVRCRPVAGLVLEAAEAGRLLTLTQGTTRDQVMALSWVRDLLVDAFAQTDDVSSLDQVHQSLLDRAEDR